MAVSLNAQVIRMDAKKTEEEIKMLEAAEKLRTELEDKGFGDRYSNMQQASAPDIDKSLLYQRIEVLLSYTEPNGKDLKVWARGELVGIPEKAKAKAKASKGIKRKRNAKPPPANNLAIVKWDATYLTKGKVNPQLVKLLPSKWNKHLLGAWGFILTDD